MKRFLKAKWKKKEKNLTNPEQHNPSSPKERQRLCLAGGMVVPESQLIRFVITHEGAVVPDFSARLPGRGAWVEARREAINKVVKKKLFVHAFRRRVDVDEALADNIGKTLLKRSLSLLGLARRAGIVICGFDAVKASLKEAWPACLVEASDGAENGRIKLLRLADALWDDVPVAGCFTAEVLGHAVGRAWVHHMLLPQSTLGQRFLREMGRLNGFVSLFPDDWHRMDA